MKFSAILFIAVIFSPSVFSANDRHAYPKTNWPKNCENFSSIRENAIQDAIRRCELDNRFIAVSP